MCQKKEILVEHHIRGRDIPNPNHPSNLANICPGCHMAVHYGVTVIEKWVAGTTGNFLAWHKKSEQGLTGDDSTTYQIGGKYERKTE